MSDDCWNRIGVEGDRSCPQLQTVIHCRNCSVYSLAGRSLLEREAPPEYLNEWTNVVAQNQLTSSLSQVNGVVRSTGKISTMIFRLGNEWLAVPVQLLQEITQACVIQKLPHRSNELFMGLVNIRGEILLCVSLNHLLNLELMVEGTAAKVPTSKRMMVIADGENRWVFPVDEVCGVYRFQLDELEKTPVVISKASAAYTQGVINWQGQKVNYLDFDLLFYTLSRRIL